MTRADTWTIERDLPVLEAIAADPSLSQRQVASRTGLSTARANFILRRLVEKGLVKVRRAAHSKHKFRYLYILTPTGLEAKAKLTYRFMRRMAEQYRAMVDQVEERLAGALSQAGQDGSNGTIRLCIAGDCPLAEVVRDLVALHEHVIVIDDESGADIVVVADPELGRRTEGPSRWVHLA